jgi:putative ABC transport system ATP-binding protein
MAFIELNGLTRNYDGNVTALDGVSLSIEKGEWLAVMGPSGSGKTTLLNILGGLDQPDSGSVEVDGRDLTRLSARQRTRYRREEVGLVFQQYHLIPYLTALENVMLAQYLHSMADVDEATRALEEVSLGHRLHHLPGRMSGGERQRVCIARALINRPKLVLADEPTGSLDQENAGIVLDLFRRMNERGQTLVVVTHDLAVGRLADRQLQLEHGRVAGFHLTHAQRDEDTDEVLEYLWLVKEGGEIPPEVCVRGAQLAQTSLTDRMVEQNLVRRDAAHEALLTEEGRRRAQILIRRHRLAEMLFSETFQMQPDVVEEEACYFEHRLSPPMTESICSFLGHPEQCPHDRPIPSGDCCTRARQG